MTTAVIVANLAATVFLIIAAWIVQIVHYPRFRRVGISQIPGYGQVHNALMTLLVAPLMVLELATACALLLLRPDEIPWWMPVAGLVLVALAWITTWLIQAPRRSDVWPWRDGDAYRSLVSTNWVRTALWSARGVLVVTMALLLFI